MGRGKSWTAVLTMVAVSVMISAAALAGEGKGEGTGKGKQAGRRRAKGQRMGSETLRKEFEQFKASMKALKEEAGAFRDKVKKAVQTAHQGEGKPTREMIKEAVIQYQAEAKQIATKITSERIRHNQALVSILNAEKSQIIDRLTKGLLIPHGGPGGGKNRHKGKGKGQAGERKRVGNMKIDPAGYDVRIDVPK